MLPTDSIPLPGALPPSSREASSPHPGDAMPLGRRVVLILVLGLLTALGPATIDLALPAFPAIGASLGVGEVAVQATLAGTMIGFGLGQLIVGPLSDRLGRRGPLLAATVIHVAASVAAVFATDLTVFLGLRLIQGFGAAAGAVVAMAVVRDLFGGKPLVRVMSRLALVSGLAPVVAPIVGSQLLAVMDWRGLFWVLAGLGAVTLIAVLIAVPETLPRSLRGSGRRLIDRYRTVLRDRIYVGAVVMGGLNFAGLFAYLSTSPFLFQEVYGMDAQQFGLAFAANSIGVIVGVQTSSYLMRHVAGPQWVLAGSTLLQLAAAIGIVVASLLGGGFWGIAVPLWLYIVGCGFGFPAINTMGMVRHGADAGTAASLLGAVSFVTAGLLAPVVGMLGVASAAPMGAMMAVVVLGAIAMLWLVVRPRTVPALTD